MKASLLAVAFGNLACLAAMAQSTNVYSINAVGYVNLTCPPGFSAVAWQLYENTNNDPAFQLENSSGLYDGWQIMIWTNGGFAKYIGDHTAGTNGVNGWLEPNGPIMLSPGVGALVYNPAPTNFAITVVGTVPQGTFSNVLGPGLNLASINFPESGGLSSKMSFPSLASGAFDGDQVYLLYSNTAASSYTTYTVDSLSYKLPGNLGWDGPAGMGEPFINTGQAFWYRAANGPVPWTITFAVNQVVGSARQSFVLGKAPTIVGRRNFQTTFSGEIGKRYVVEQSSDLRTWRAAETNLMSSRFWMFKDPEPATNQSRYYRAYALP